MSININRQSTQKSIVIEQNKAQKQQDVNKQKQTAGTGSSKDSVQLTSQALNLNKMQEQTSEPKINSQRIESLKSAILNGEYKINTDRLAEKLSRFEGDFSKAFG
jgi:negative regulator of flagellin synthesis FlgM